MATKNRSLPTPHKNFGATPPATIPRSTFNLNKNWKGTFDAGKLIPFYVSEGLPGDTRKVRVSAICRLATPFKPFMDNLFLDFHFWWCPNRQLWSNWVKLMGEQENPGDSIDYLVPQVRIGDQASLDELGDHMGLPPSSLAQVSSSYTVSALPFRMYNRVYNFHYRDQNLISSVPQDTGDGEDTSSDYEVLKRGKRHDYLTASLPFQQKGNPVDLPLGDLAPIQGIGVIQGQTLPVTNTAVTETGGGAATYVNAAISANIANFMAFEGENSGGDPAIYADLANATAATITDLRQAIAVQHVLERDARSGSRYPEILLSRFRVMDPQMLVLQRPEYLGGGTKSISISPVPQTAEGATTPIGNLAAVGTAMVDGIGFTRSFTEHGWIMGIVSARADLTYQQGVERMWNRKARFDFFHPELAHLSEQAVTYKEIYVTGTDVDDDAVWGYIGAYDEYRYGQSLITGEFRSGVAQTLDVWHLSQFFATRPTLNKTFIEEDPPVDRVVVVQTEPQFIMDAFISDTAARPLPISGIPGLTRI